MWGPINSCDCRQRIQDHLPMRGQRARVRVRGGFRARTTLHVGRLDSGLPLTNRTPNGTRRSPLFPHNVNFSPLWQLVFQKTALISLITPALMPSQGNRGGISPREYTINFSCVSTTRNVSNSASKGEPFSPFISPHLAIFVFPSPSPPRRPPYLCIETSRANRPKSRKTRSMIVCAPRFLCCQAPQGPLILLHVVCLHHTPQPCPPRAARPSRPLQPAAPSRSRPLCKELASSVTFPILPPRGVKAQAMYMSPALPAAASPICISTPRGVSLRPPFRGP